MQYKDYSYTTSNALLIKNSLINFFGQGLPLAIALITIPLLVTGLGVERFGLLNILWMIIGYFGIFDLGIGRATTKFVADYIAKKQWAGLPSLVWTSWGLLVLLGIVGGIVLAIITPYIVNHLFHLPDSLISEATASLYLLAVAVPMLLLSAGVIGVLEAQQRFDVINAVQIPSQILFYVIPLLATLITVDLYIIIKSLLLSRLVFLAILLYICLFITMPNLRSWPSQYQKHVLPVLRYGGWLTISNVVSPIMVYIDRLFIAAFLGLSAVTYYVVPYTIINKLLLIPISVVKVLFPAFSQMSVMSSESLREMYDNVVKCVFVVVLPFIMVAIMFSYELMSLWMGDSFASNSWTVVIWLSLGVFLNSLAQIPFTLIQAVGRPDITAKFHLVEVIPYVIILVLLTRSFGVTGVAMAWFVRVLLDTILLFWYASKILKEAKHKANSLFITIGIIVLCIMAFCLSQLNTSTKMGLALIILVGSMIIIWRYWLDIRERRSVACLWRNCANFLAQFRSA